MHIPIRQAFAFDVTLPYMGASSVASSVSRLLKRVERRGVMLSGSGLAEGAEGATTLPFVLMRFGGDETLSPSFFLLLGEEGFCLDFADFGMGRM